MGASGISNGWGPESRSTPHHAQAGPLLTTRNVDSAEAEDPDVREALKLGGAPASSGAGCPTSEGLASSPPCPQHPAQSLHWQWE